MAQVFDSLSYADKHLPIVDQQPANVCHKSIWDSTTRPLLTNLWQKAVNISVVAFFRTGGPFSEKRCLTRFFFPGYGVLLLKRAESQEKFKQVSIYNKPESKIFKNIWKYKSKDFIFVDMFYIRAIIFLLTVNEYET